MSSVADDLSLRPNNGAGVEENDNGGAPPRMVPPRVVREGANIPPSSPPANNEDTSASDSPTSPADGTEQMDDGTQQMDDGTQPMDIEVGVDQSKNEGKLMVEALPLPTEWKVIKRKPYVTQSFQRAQNSSTIIQIEERKYTGLPKAVETVIVITQITKKNRCATNDLIAKTLIKYFSDI